MELDGLFENRIDVTGDAAEWAKALPGGGGVYVLTDEQDRLVLLAGGESLRRSVTYRLAPPPEASRKRADLKAVVRRIRWQRTYSPFETAYEYHRMARVLTPGTYLEACAFGPAWFVRVDVAARLPRMTTAKYLGAGPALAACPLPSGENRAGNCGVELGPFPTRTAAERFIEVLQDLFDLCRYHHILEQAPCGQPCAYFEMGKCPAPCSGGISLETYREMITAAAAFGAGGWRNDVPRWQEAMRAMARRQQFEGANRMKQRLQRAETLRGRDYRLVRSVDTFHYLILQRGEGTTHVRPFLVRGGWIERGPSAAKKDLAVAVAGWVEAMRAPPTAPGPPTREDCAASIGSGVPGDVRTEWIWLVSHYLFKGDEAPGLFLGPEEWPRVEEWLPRVAEKVLRARPVAEAEAADHADPGSPGGGVAMP